MSDKPERHWIYEVVVNLFFLCLENLPQIFRWVLAITVLVFPPIYLAYNPSHFTPLVDTMLSVFMFLLAYWIGNNNELHRAQKRANDKWLPQAESVIFRLITLHANVQRFSDSTRSSCARTTSDLPELEKDTMRAVRIKLKTDCEASAHRLDDIAYQLEDAIEDWNRFVAENCFGEECSRIFEAIEARQSQFDYGNGDYAYQGCDPP